MLVRFSALLFLLLVFLINLCVHLVHGGYRDSRSLEPLLAWCSTELHLGWTACRRPAVPSLGCDVNHDRWNVTTLPTTALAVLLNNHKIEGLEDINMDNLYFSKNLALIPDISDVGPAFYTLLYELEIPPLRMEAAACRSSSGDENHIVSATRQTIRFAGTNYRAQAWLDGVPLVELDSHGGAPGMFVRRNFNVTTGGRFNILIEPPDHPGIPDGGQGGE